MNPNFTKEMITPELTEACQQTLDKYTGKGEMDAECLICEVFRSNILILPDCFHCLLKNSEYLLAPCADDPTYIPGFMRKHVPKEKLLARAKRLHEIFTEHGIEVKL